MKFKQIPNSISIKNSSQTLLHLGLQIIIAGAAIYFIPNQPISPFIGIPFIILSLLFFRYLRKYIRKYAPDWIRDKNVLGQIDISNTEIKAYSDQEILLSEFQEVEFQYNYIRGNKFGRDPIHNGLAALFITTKDEKKIVLKFIIESKDQFDGLKPILKSWYQQGIAVKEYFDNHKVKTICLETTGNKSYKEMQALKEELKIKS